MSNFCRQQDYQLRRRRAASSRRFWCAILAAVCAAALVASGLCLLVIRSSGAVMGEYYGGGGGGMLQTLPQLLLQPSTSSLPSAVTAAAPGNGRHPRPPPQPNNNMSFSACLLVMDENHRLPEWLAYHWYVLPLTYLVVAVDPHSRTSPSPILERWRQSGMMKIVQVSDEGMGFKRKSQAAVGPGSMRSISEHRDRQEAFGRYCINHLRRHNPRTYAAFIDADEYLTVNGDAVRDARTFASEHPGSVLEVFRQMFAEDDGGSKGEGSGSFPPIAPRRQEFSGNQAEEGQITLETWKGYFREASPCVVVPRILFSAVEKDRDRSADDVDVPDWVDEDRFETLRWRFRATRRYNGTSLSDFGGDKKVEKYYHGIDDWGKSILDVSKVKREHFVGGSNAHMPLKSVCRQRYMQRPYQSTPVGIHHYLGSLEAFSCREDVREGTSYHGEAKWRRLAPLRDGGADDQAAGWLQGFIQKVGNEETARNLLQGAGELSGCKERKSSPSPIVVA